MKVNLKHTFGKLGQYNIRLPIALKQRLEKTRALAEELEVDFAATQIDNLDQFESELAARLNEIATQRKEAKVRGAHSIVSNSNANGPDHA
jgi:hypothetical protein